MGSTMSRTCPIPVTTSDIHESSIFMGLSDHGNAAAMIVHLETE